MSATRADTYNELKKAEDRQSETTSMEPEDIAHSFRIWDVRTNLTVFYYQRTETKAKQTVLIQFAPNYLFREILAAIILLFSIVYFNTFLHIVSHFTGHHIFIYYNLF